MNEYVNKVVTDVLELDRADPRASCVRVKATHARDTSGNSYIALEVDNNTVLKFTDNTFGSDYRSATRKVAEMLLRICDHPCQLPTDAAK